MIIDAHMDLWDKIDGRLDTNAAGGRLVQPAKDPEAARKYIYGQHPLGRIGTIEECGTVAAFLVSDEASFVTGAVIAVDGGVTFGY